MKLYRAAGHLWLGTQAEAKAVAREHGTKWTAVDVPTDKPGLIAWLNDEGRVIPATEPDILEPQLASEGQGDEPWIAGEATRDPPRYAPQYGRQFEDRVEFVPVTRAAEINRQLGRCPRCSGTPLARVLDWIGEASLDDLDKAANHIRDQVADMKAQLAGGGQ